MISTPLAMAVDALLAPYRVSTIPMNSVNRRVRRCRNYCVRVRPHERFCCPVCRVGYRGLDFNADAGLAEVTKSLETEWTLRSVVFEDGEFVGTSEYGDFELFTGKMQGTREVGMMAKSGEWDQVEALAPDPLPPLLGRCPRGEDPILHFGRKVAALHLVQERKQKGHAAAIKLAEIYSSLPTTLWK